MSSLYCDSLHGPLVLTADASGRRLAGIRFAEDTDRQHQQHLSILDRYAELLATHWDLRAYSPRLTTDCNWSTLSPFAQRLLCLLASSVGPGQSTTYKTLAQQLHSAPRAVGQVLRRNPFPVLIPCHRCIGLRDLGGFQGQRAAIGSRKHRMLLAEKQACLQSPIADERNFHHVANKQITANPIGFVDSIHE